MVPYGEEVYLGDAVYAAFDGHYVRLTANPGGDEQRIYLEHEVWLKLVAFTRIHEIPEGRQK
jgi:hypothetical protein